MLDKLKLTFLLSPNTSLELLAGGKLKGFEGVAVVCKDEDWELACAVTEEGLVDAVVIVG